VSYEQAIAGSVDDSISQWWSYAAMTVWETAWHFVVQTLPHHALVERMVLKYPERVANMALYLSCSQAMANPTICWWLYDYM